MNNQHYFDRIQSFEDDADFRNFALEVFRYQAQNNKTYGAFIRQMNIAFEDVRNIHSIPFLPVELFKSNRIITGDDSFKQVFTSSGTTGENVSSHFVKDILLYEKVFTNIFSNSYGNPNDFVILALLPSYLEREGSSLVYMMDKLIHQTKSQQSGFYLDQFENLSSVLQQLQKQKKKTILFGVTYALLDFVAAFSMNFPELIVMETGGMKGKRKEMIREEVHELLCKGFGVKNIHSEYGMTELLSQAYSNGNGIFKSPPWMRVLIRDPYDPLQSAGINSAGGINIIDLANIDSCAFLSTQDLGKVYEDNSFEVIGRFDFSDVRGCNLMIE